MVSNWNKLKGFFVCPSSIDEIGMIHWSTFFRRLLHFAAALPGREEYPPMYAHGVAGARRDGRNCGYFLPVFSIRNIRSPSSSKSWTWTGRIFSTLARKSSRSSMSNVPLNVWRAREGSAKTMRTE